MKQLNYPLQKPSTGCYAATIGCFDGVHRGHRFLVDTLQAEAAKRGLQSMVVTFDRPPRLLFQPDWQPQLITMPQERSALLAATGIDLLAELRFDREMAQLSARDFMEQVLARDLRVRFLLMGYDNRFGRKSEETFSDYAAYGQALDIEVMAATPLTFQGQRVCSSFVRGLLQEGRVKQAADCLMRPYMLSGTVVKGFQLGRKMGFPTANMVPLDEERIVPANGVYAVTVSLAAEGEAVAGSGGAAESDVVAPKQRPLYGVMNIGRRPTFHGEETTLEVHILDFTGDLYGRRITVGFIDRLRDEQPFASAEALASQMQRDVTLAKQIFSTSKTIV